MRSSRQKLYDDFYYGFERWLVVLFEDFRARKRVRKIQFSPEFYTNFKNVVRPYWAQFGVRPKLCRIKDNYLLHHSLDPRYIPGDLYLRKIIPHFNPLDSVNTLTDKNLNSLLYPAAPRPATAFKHMSGQYCLDDFTPVTRAEAIARIAPGQGYVIKPSRDSSEGMDVRFFTAEDDLDELLNRFRGADYIVQEAVRQHPVLASLNDSSVNTLRFVTLLFQGKAHLLSAILRVGAPGSRVDNIGAGGYQLTFRPDGTLTDVAYTIVHGKPVFLREQIGDIRFAGMAIPGFHEARELVLSLAAQTPHLKLIAWDIAIDEQARPVLIEFNASMPGQNQETCGPTFGDLTDDVLAEVFGKKGAP
ncbi:MAG: sugar-transfer associated ATP-grasp domain-containing protein [Oscillospiraceae bacterium]